ncbi:MAG: DUF4912 domain-containing protein [Gammaproteobacteria bacterium]
MLEISHEINSRFAPNAASLIPDIVDFSFSESDLLPFLHPARLENKTVLRSWHDPDLGLTPRELLEISEDISSRYPPLARTATPELLLLPVDPDHLYACWDLGEYKKSMESQQPSANGLTLRIYWLPDESTAASGSNVWFDVDVHEASSRQKVRLPLDDSAYSAALGRVNADQSFDAYAQSNIVRVPPGGSRMQFQRRDVIGNAEGGPRPPCPIPDTTAAAPPGVLSPSEDKLPDILARLQHFGQTRESGWFVKLHVRQARNVSIISCLAQLLNEAGIDIQLIPESGFSEKASFQGKTASGQGL